MALRETSQEADSNVIEMRYFSGNFEI